MHELFAGVNECAVLGQQLDETYIFYGGMFDATAMHRAMNVGARLPPCMSCGIGVMTVGSLSLVCPHHTPQVNGPAMQRAMEIFRDLVRYNKPAVNTTTCQSLIDNTFNTRTCMITVRWAEVLKVGQYMYEEMRGCGSLSGACGPNGSLPHCNVTDALFT